MINKFKINQILQCFRSAPVSPEGEPAHTLILNLKLVNRVLAPLQGAGGSVSMLFLAEFLNRY